MWDTDEEGNVRRTDISADGRYYVVFKTASASQRQALLSAAGQDKFVARPDGSQERELKSWDTIEAALRLGLIVEMRLPMVDEQGELAEFVMERGDDPKKVAAELDNVLSMQMEAILLGMITDFYVNPEQEQVVMEAKNS